MTMISNASGLTTGQLEYKDKRAAMEAICSVSSPLLQILCGGIKASSSPFQLKLYSLRHPAQALPSEQESANFSDSEQGQLQSALEKAAAYRKRKAPATRGTGTSSGSVTKAVESISDASAKETGVQAEVGLEQNVASTADNLSSDSLGGNPSLSNSSEDAARNDAEQKQKKDLSARRPGSNQPNEIEIEIITRDGVIKRKAMKPQVVEIKKTGKEFAGLGLAARRKTGAPAGLSAEFEAPPPGLLPGVQSRTKDAGIARSSLSAEQQTADFYKPKVSTWGVFPRPSDISKTYGGGRTIRPGDELETEEQRQAREARTQQLLAEYRRKLGLDVDPMITMECQQMMNDGDVLMKSGKFTEAVDCFDNILQKLAFQSELHGRAALQKAVCLESLNRSCDARVIYEKLLSHSNQTVRKKARQFLFSFQAADSLRLSSSSSWDSGTYAQYFDLFPKNYPSYNTSYRAEETGGPSVEEVLRYAALLLFPVILVFAVIILRPGR